MEGGQNFGALRRLIQARAVKISVHYTALYRLGLSKFGAPRHLVQAPLLYLVCRKNMRAVCSKGLRFSYTNSE